MKRTAAMANTCSSGSYRTTRRRLLQYDELTGDSPNTRRSVETDLHQVPRHLCFEERSGRFIPRVPMDVKKVTGVEQRNTVQRWSNKAAAGADSWKRCEWESVPGLTVRPGGRILGHHRGHGMRNELQGAD